VRLLRDVGASFGKTTKGWFFGCKLHVLVNAGGQVLSALLTPANPVDADAALALAWGTDGGVVLGDRASRAAELKALLAEEAEVLRLTPGDATGEQRALISSLRERVETTFSPLWHRFVDRVFSRSWEGLWSTIKLKLLHLNLSLAGFIQQ
jgi:transposase